MDRKQALKNKLIRYLASEDVEESADNGLAVFEKINEEMRAMLQDNMQDAGGAKLADLKAVLKEEPSSEEVSPGVSDTEKLKKVLEEFGVSSVTKQEELGKLAALLKVATETGALETLAQENKQAMERGKEIGVSSKSTLKSKASVFRLTLCIMQLTDLRV